MEIPKQVSRTAWAGAAEDQIGGRCVKLPATGPFSSPGADLRMWIEALLRGPPTLYSLKSDRKIFSALVWATKDNKEKSKALTEKGHQHSSGLLLTRTEA